MRELALVFVLLGVPAQDADEQYAYVAALAEKGLHERVVREAQAFLRAHPEHARARAARYRLACALFELGRDAEARAAFAELARLPDFEFAAEVQFRLGQCLARAGERAAAEACFARVLQLGKDYLRAPTLALLAESELARKAHAEALAHYDALVALGGQAADYQADAQVGRVWCLFRLGRHAEAASAARAASRGAGPERAAELAFLLGECLLEQQDARGAASAYARVESGPFADAALRGAGFAQLALGDPRAAAQRFGAVRSRFPASTHRRECALQEGAAWLAAGEPKAALDALAAPELDADAEALAWRARAQSESGDAPAALATLGRALGLKPAPELTERLALQRAELLTRLGRGEEAARDYERAGTDRALLAAAVHELTARRFPSARQQATRLLERFPESPLRVEALLALAEGLFGEGRHAEAEEAFLAAAEQDGDAPRRTRAAARAAWCSYLRGEHAAAAERFERVAQSRLELPEVEEAAFMVGRAREDAGDRGGARAAYTACAKRFPRGAQRAEAQLRAALLADGPAALAELERLAGAMEQGGGELGARAAFELGERLQAEGRHEEALARFAAAAANPAAGALAPRASYARAWSLFQLERHDECEHELAPLLAARELQASLAAATRELAVWCALRRQDSAALGARWTAYLGGAPETQRASELLRAVCAAWSALERPAEARAAVEAFERALPDPAARGVAALERALLAAGSGDSAAAQRELERARALGADGPQAAEALFRLGEQRFAAGADAEAIPLYEAAARQADAPVAPGALYKLGFARLRAGDAAGAERAFATLCERHPQHELVHESRFLLGEARYRSKRYAEAAECLERVRQEAPRHAILPKVLFRLGLARGQREEWKACAEVLSELARRAPDFPNLAEAELWRGRALAGLDDARGARAAFERVLALDKTALSAQAHLELGRLAHAREDLDGALSEFLKVAMLYTATEEVAEALVLAGQVLEEQGQHAEAQKQYREAVEQHPNARYTAEARKRLKSAPPR